VRITVGALMTRLGAEGLANDADTAAVRAALNVTGDEQLPIYLRILVGLGAWVATILLMFFLFALGLLEDKSAAVVFGVVLVSGAVWLRHSARGDFWRNATVAASFAGQGLIVAAVEMIWRTSATAFTVAAIISIVMIVLVPDPLHRFVSTAIAVGATAAALVALHTPRAMDITALLTVVVAAWVWRVDVRRHSDEATEMLAPVGYGLAVGLFGLCLFGAFHSVVDGARTHAPALGAVTTDGIAVMLALFVMTILREHDTSPSSVVGVTILVIIALFAAVTARSPGIIAGVSILLLGFDRRNLVLIELATAFLIVFGAVNYYTLDLTLLEKSGILIASGALCILTRVVLGKWPLAREAASS
jgi:hypothetical protein